MAVGKAIGCFARSGMAPSSGLVNALTLPGVGVGVGVDVGVGVGTGVGEGAGVGVGTGVGEGTGVGLGVGTGEGAGLGAGVPPPPELESPPHAERDRRILAAARSWTRCRFMPEQIPIKAMDTPKKIGMRCIDPFATTLRPTASCQIDCGGHNMARTLGGEPWVIFVKPKNYQPL